MRKLNLFKIFPALFILTCLTVITLSPTIVSAKTKVINKPPQIILRKPMGGKLINGPRNILYTVSSSAQKYVLNINTAANNWMYTGSDNPIYMTSVSNTYGSTIDIYSYSEGRPDIIAFTNFWITNDKAAYPDWGQNYLFSQIWFNDLYASDYSINHYAIAAHEMGHVLGLDDVYDNNSAYTTIMYGYGSSMKVYRPTYSDGEEIVSLYGRY